MMGNSGSTALQRLLGDHRSAQKESMLTPQQSPLSGIGKFTKMGEDRLDAGLTDAMTGNLNMSQSSSLGTSFNRKSSNPWEAFLATPAQEETQGQNSPFAAYKPQARGINMSLW